MLLGSHFQQMVPGFPIPLALLTIFGFFTPSSQHLCLLSRIILPSRVCLDCSFLEGKDLGIFVPLEQLLPSDWQAQEYKYPSSPVLMGMTLRRHQLSPASLWGCNKVTLCWVDIVLLFGFLFFLVPFSYSFHVFLGTLSNISVLHEFSSQSLRNITPNPLKDVSEGLTYLLVLVELNPIHSPNLFVCIPMLPTGFFCFAFFFFF